MPLQTKFGLDLILTFATRGTKAKEMLLKCYKTDESSPTVYQRYI
jgi:hypothetical protein